MQHGSSLWDYPPTRPFCSSHPPCSASLSPLQPHPPLPSVIGFSFKMPPLSASRSDFTLTSPILRLMPEQRPFPHFVTSCLDGAAEVFIVHLLYPEPLNSVCVSVKVRRSSPIWWLVEPLARRRSERMETLADLTSPGHTEHTRSTKDGPLLGNLN